jgi:hypothetical protein
VSNPDQLVLTVPEAQLTVRSRRTRRTRRSGDSPPALSRGAASPECGTLDRGQQGTATSGQPDPRWREQDVVSVPFAGMQVLGLSRQGSYDAANRGEIPTLRVGRRLLVPVVRLRRLLGETV